MKKELIGALLLVMVFCKSHSGPKIILKLDDLSVKKGVCQFIPVMDYLVKNQIKAGLGVIAAKIDSTAPESLRPYLNATNRKGEKLFEIWHHGLDHIRPEFQGTGYDYQKSHFDQADRRIKEILGIQMHTFGSPFNGNDSVTFRVVSENPDYSVFLFSGEESGKKKDFMHLNHRINIENGTGNPEFSLFLESYNKYRDKYTDYMVLQAHPNMFTPDRLEQFKKIVEFLMKEGCEFVLPEEYYLLNNKT